MYETEGGDTLDTIAAGVTRAINKASVNGVTATQNPVTKRTLIDLTGANGPESRHGGHHVRPDSAGHDRHVALRRRGVQRAPLHTLRFFGEMSSDTKQVLEHIAIYVHINPGGSAATFGVFVNPSLLRKDEMPRSMTAINTTPAAVRGLVSATAIGSM